MNWLAVQRGFAYRDIAGAEPPGPDLIARTDDGDIGIEVVTAYYNDDDATARWSWARGDRSRTGSALIGPDEQLAAFVQIAADKKCAKTYDFDGPLWLLIDARPALSDECDIERIATETRVAEHPPFSVIHLGVDLPISTGRPTAHEGHYWVWQLHPRV